MLSREQLDKAIEKYPVIEKIYEESHLGQLYLCITALFFCPKSDTSLRYYIRLIGSRFRLRKKLKMESIRANHL